MFPENYKWHYDYARLALDAGFHFQQHKSETLDRSKISLIDVDRVIKERDIAAVEKFLCSVYRYDLDPEQAGVLDGGFVNVFRLSQLSVEYLLFCKKYLDDTVVLLKKESKKLDEENKELKLFVDDLKEHISALMNEVKEKNQMPTFKCGDCGKAFSTEDFLQSHIKRRHFNTHDKNLPIEAETEKLHLEIKELKGRLNSAEKSIQKDQNQLQTSTDMTAQIEKSIFKFHENDSKMCELQEKFQSLKAQVESELKILKSHHYFEEKYEKWFDRVSRSFKPDGQDRGGGDLGQRRESTTQTDMKYFESLDANKEPQDEHTTLDDAQTPVDAQKPLSDDLEVKVSKSFQKIEDQMQSFWIKLNEIEEGSKKGNVQAPQGDPGQVARQPVVRPRSKYTVRQVATANIELPKDPPIAKADDLEERVIIMKEQLLSSDSDVSSSDSSDSSVSESKTSEEMSVLRKGVDQDLLDHFKVEVESIIKGRLQDLGISLEWTGLPLKSFQRALEIVNHQAGQVKKTFPDFTILSRKIEKDIEDRVKAGNVQKFKKAEVSLPRPRVLRSKSYTKITRDVAPSRHVDIKNREIYETDTDTDLEHPPDASKVEVKSPYVHVVQELKSKMAMDNVDKLPGDDETKGVLKNYPSAGSLNTTKKKVLFNLEPEQQFIQGSNTTIASSVLDGSPTPRTKSTKETQEIEDLSDFDLSEF